MPSNGKCIPKIISHRFRTASVTLTHIPFLSLSSLLAPHNNVQARVWRLCARVCVCVCMFVPSFLHTTTSLESNYDYNGICFTENAYFWPIIHILFYRMSVRTHSALIQIMKWWVCACALFVCVFNLRGVNVESAHSPNRCSMLMLAFQVIIVCWVFFCHAVSLAYTTRSKSLFLCSWYFTDYLCFVALLL